MQPAVSFGYGASFLPRLRPTVSRKEAVFKLNLLRRIAHFLRQPQRTQGSSEVSLRDLPDGALARIVVIACPQLKGPVSHPFDCCAARLESLGLRTGKIVEKISGMPFHGPVTLMLDGRQIAIGWNISSYVMVVPLKEREDPRGRNPEQN
jgi:ferrous iron transport protein A